MKPIVGEVFKGVVFMVIGAALFAANPRFGTASGPYLFSCSAGIGLRWDTSENKLYVMDKPQCPAD